MDKPFVCWNPFITRNNLTKASISVSLPIRGLSQSPLHCVESGSSASGRRRSLRLEVCTSERIDKPNEEVMVLYFSSSPLLSPTGGTVGDSTPPHPPDQTSSAQLKPTMQSRVCGNIVIADSFSH